MNQSETFETGCCRRFNPEPWHNKKVEFNNKLFLKDHVNSIFHIPLNYGKVISRDMAMIESAGVKSEALVLNDENSLWGSDVYIAIEKEVPEAEMEKITGTFYSKAYEGPYTEMNKYIKDMKQYVASKGEEVKKLFFYYYTYCPKCAKAYGSNFIVILAQI